MPASPNLPPRYENPQRIGSGGMADIFLARDRELGRDVAVKVLAERFASDPAIRNRFKREALASARLSGQPHVITIFDVGEWDERPFIVMEYLSGGTVAERTRRRRVPIGEVMTWLEEAAEALDAAHAAGIVHRDVKPANLLFDGRGELHVADFGIARVVDETGSLTASGTILGTAGYLSPEQARGEPATTASDVYGLAVVAYELLTGARPFERESATAEAAAHAHEPVPPASAREPDLPRTVDEVFERALAKDPEERHETAGEFVQDLRAALAAGEEMTRALPIAAPPAGAPPRRTARRVLPYVLGGLLLAGGIGAAAALTAATGGDEKADSATTVVRRRTVIKRGKPVVRRVTVTETTPAEPPPAAPPPVSPPPPASPPPAASGDGHALNDQGYALVQEGRYSEALPLLQQAVQALRGTYTSSDPYEAYADYNLGYTLLQLGRCSEALPYLDRSERLQGYRVEIDQAQAAAHECLGGNGEGKGKAKGKGKEKD